MAATDLTAQKLRELLSYNPATGLFSWRRTVGYRAQAGQLAGYHNVRGYWLIKVNGRHRPAHVLAWLYVHGEWPFQHIDHINCDRKDNRITNLRLATATQNQANSCRRKDNKSGVKGVHWNRRMGKWVSSIQCAGKRMRLGSFASLEDARLAYADAAKKHFGEFARA